MVELTFNQEGAEIFGELTTRLKGQQIAIFVGGEMLTAPTVNDAILTGKAVITGNYTSETATKLSQDINTGVVPAPIYLTSERTIDSKLGLNSLNQLI
ncbi:MAG: protein translocase subunit SecD, partial [Candidatus Gracilibacteria bacterium]|nr:protein translocase subunit SecD [Candidatus Gracilibacteria bacterium]